MKRFNIFLVSIITLACSCSVKEDREACPCWMEIDLSTCHHFTDRVALKGWTDAGPVFGVNVLEEDFPRIHEEEVPRKLIRYSASSTPVDATYSGTIVTIPEGRQSDRFYAYRADVPAFGESAYDKVSLHKQYAAVAVKVEDAGEGCTVTVKGAWNGIDLTTLKPVAGSFSYVPETAEENVWYFRVPRQGDDSLVMEITGGNGHTIPYDLGGLIRDSGYDWKAEDLDDIMLGVDYVTGTVSVKVIGWEEGLIYDEII